MGVGALGLIGAYLFNSNIIFQGHQDVLITNTDALDLAAEQVLINNNNLNVVAVRQGNLSNLQADFNAALLAHEELNAGNIRTLWDFCTGLALQITSMQENISVNTEIQNGNNRSFINRLNATEDQTHVNTTYIRNLTLGMNEQGDLINELYDEVHN